MIRDKRRLFAQGFVPRLAVSLSTKAEAEMKLLYLDAQPTTPWIQGILLENRLWICRGHSFIRVPKGPGLDDALPDVLLLQAPQPDGWEQVAR